MRARPPLALLALLAPLAGCLSLEPMAHNVCGNAVVEPGEDCEPTPGGSCLPAGSPHECRYDCAPDESGVRPACPADMVCGLASVCIRHSGTFEVTSGVEVRADTTLGTGDLDGDGARDLLASGTGLLGIVHVGPDGQLETPIRFHDTSIMPIAAQLTGAAGDSGAADDFVFGYGGLIVQRGGADRSYGAVTFAPVPLPAEAPDAKIAVFNAVAPKQVGQSVENLGDEVVAMRASDVWLLDVASLQWQLGTLPPADAQLDNPQVVAANLNEQDPLKECDELLLGGGTRDLDVVAPCNAEGNWIQGDALGDYPAIVLPKGCNADGGLLVTDVNQDGHLDIVAASSCPTPQSGTELFLASCDPSSDPAQTGAASIWIAYGTGDGTFTAADAFDGGMLPSAIGCHIAPVMNAELETLLGTARSNLLALGAAPDAPLLFDAADLNGDGVPDYVLRDSSLILSEPNSDANIHSARTAHYVAMTYPDFPSWDMARIADFNGNGHPDIIVGSHEQSELLFLNGTPEGWPAAIHIPLASPPDHLVLGDFDGDQLPDVAFVEVGPPDTLAICFGQPFGAPTEPVPVARLGEISDVLSGNLAFGGTDGLDDLLVVGEQLGHRSAALLLGSPDRRIYSPFFLAPGIMAQLGPDETPADVEFGFVASAMAATELDGDDAAHTDIVLLTRPGSRVDLPVDLADNYLWLLPVTGDAVIDPAQVAAPLALDATGVPGLDANYDWSSALLASVDLDGRLTSEGKPLDELVVLAQGKLGTPAAGRGTMLVVTPASTDGNPPSPPSYRAAQLEQDLELYFHGPRDFSAPVASDGSNGAPYRGLAMTGDVNGDGLTDVVALGASGSGSTLRRSVIVLAGRGGGDLSQALGWNDRIDVSAALGGVGPTSFTLQRVAPDPALHIVLLDESGIYWTKIDANGQALTPVSMTDGALAPLSGGGSVAAGDFNGDNLWDLAVVRTAPGSQSTAITTLDVLLGQERAR